MTKPLKTLFVIADGAHARWVRRSGDGRDFATLKVLEAEPRPHGHPQGVAFEGHTGRPANVEPRQDPAREQRVRFAADVARAINAEADAEDLDRLVVVAPARVQAALQQRLSGAARTKLAGVLAKDLTKTPDHELAGWLRAFEIG